MKTNIIKEIWEIRGKISLAEDKKDLEIFNVAKELFCNLYKNKKHLQTISTMTAGKMYSTEEELDFDRETNFAMLAYDLNRNRKYVLGDFSSSLRNIQMSSPIEVLWYTREMFDEFLTNAKTNRFAKEDNQNIYEAIQINLSEILECYKGFTDKTSIDEKITIRMLKKDIEQTYTKFYDNNFDFMSKD